MLYTSAAHLRWGSHCFKRLWYWRWWHLKLLLTELGSGIRKTLVHTSRQVERPVTRYTHWTSKGRQQLASFLPITDINSGTDNYLARNRRYVTAANGKHYACSNRIHSLCHTIGTITSLLGTPPLHVSLLCGRMVAIELNQYRYTAPESTTNHALRDQTPSYPRVPNTQNMGPG